MSLMSTPGDRTASSEATMRDLFAEQVRKAPLAIAVSAEGIDVSYAELDARSDRIAQWLLRNGAGPEQIVAIEMTRGHDLIAGLLGIVKAGAAYLALELDTPRERRDRLIADAGASALITTAGQLDRPGLPTLRLPGDLAQLPCESTSAPNVHPDGLAYVCYTSGSTGQPKAVGVPHRAVVRLVSGDYVDFGPGQRVLCLSPVSFDASTFEIWAPLLTGGRLVIHPAGRLSADQLAIVLHENAVTTLFLTTALFHRMVDHHLAAFAGLRQLLTGGEVLDPARFNRFIDTFPEIRLIAAYGPTENTTFTTCQTIPAPVRTAWVPLGLPITGTAVHILDADLAPVASGAAGELCTGGIGVSRGYLGQPAATALSFVPDPFGAAGSRMYRTGDIVRQRDTGEIEFVARGDRQVKVRGFRVEPGEVEREILAIPGVKEAFVATHADHLGDQQLTAFLVSDPDEDGDGDVSARVRRKLREVLPAAMIPAAFVTIDQLPLTPNGKIDRTALRIPERTARQADNEFVAPRSSTEQLLCDIWGESLKVDAVGVLDDFFELGGNSLLAMDLISRTETVFDLQLPVRALLYHPTVAEFAGAIDQLAGRGSAHA